MVKADNGSHFRNHAVEALLAEHGIMPLWSPPYYPRFNGAVEAGIGTFKARLRIIAGRDDQVGGVTDDHIEGARLLCNRWVGTAGGISPEQWWEHGERITSEEREAFQQLVAAHQERIRAQLSTWATTAQPAVAPAQPDDITLDDAAHRRAVIAALAAANVVSIRSRRIPQPLSARISA